MKRFSRDCKTVLESPRLPSTDQIRSARDRLSNMTAGDLADMYAALQQAKRSLAIRTGKISASEGEEKISFAGISKEQMVEELLQEHLKTMLGKPALPGKQASF